MAHESSKSKSPKTRKRVEMETTTLKRAMDGSAFTRCEACSKDVPVGLIDMHSCSLDSNIKKKLESQVVEKVTELKKPSERNKAASSSSEEEPKAKKGKKEKNVKDPNMRKPPRAAFFLFMDDFRKEYKEANPDSKSGSTVAMEGSAKWKSMTDEEKKPYKEKVMAEYEKVLEKSNAGNEDEQESSEKDD